MKRARSSTGTVRKTVGTSGPAGTLLHLSWAVTLLPQVNRDATAFAPCPEVLWAVAWCHLIIAQFHLGCCCWLILCNKIIKHTEHFPSSDKRYFGDVHAQFFILIMYYKETLSSVLKMFREASISCSWQILLFFYFLFSNFSKFSMFLPWFPSHTSYMFCKWFLWISRNGGESKLLLVQLCIVKDQFEKQLFEVKAQFSSNINV